MVNKDSEKKTNLLPFSKPTFTTLTCPSLHVAKKSRSSFPAEKNVKQQVTL